MRSAVVHGPPPGEVKWVCKNCKVVKWYYPKIIARFKTGLCKRCLRKKQVDKTRLML